MSATSPTTIPRESVLSDNTPEGLPPLANLSEALARGREPRKLWPVLHAVEDTTQRPLGWWEWERNTPEQSLLLHRAADICYFIGLDIADLVWQAHELVKQEQAAQCDGFDGPCESMKAKERQCRTAYHWDGTGQNPNRTPMLCDECAKAYEEYWNEMWAQAR